MVEKIPMHMRGGEVVVSDGESVEVAARLWDTTIAEASRLVGGSAFQRRGG